MPLSGPQFRPQFMFRWNHKMCGSSFRVAVDDLTCATFQWVLSHVILSSESTQLALTCQLLNSNNAASVHSLQSNSLLHGVSSPNSIGSPTGICLDQARILFLTWSMPQHSLRGWAWATQQQHWPWQWQLRHHVWLWQQHWLWRWSLQHACCYGNIIGYGP